MLTPGVFLSAVYQLNIVPQPIDQNRKSKGVVFTNEAIEALRRCHGEFIALVASDLVSRKDDTVQKHKQRTTRGEIDVTAPNAIDSKNRVHIVTPKKVLISLTALDFQEIASKISSETSSKLTDPHGDSHNNKSLCFSSSTTAKNKNTRNNPYSSGDITIKTEGGAAAQTSGSKKTKRRDNKGTLRQKKFKAAYKNNKVTADLLKEQDRLLASSAAKARMNHTSS